MASAAFERLHPAVKHHVVNTLGWRALRPMQERAIGPVLDGKHALLGAPTAGGKTEAAVLPLLSRMIEEHWGGLSILYVCPLRALLNNLVPRVAGYCELLGRTAAVWHGDVGDAQRKRILAEPPDVLLTTPESVEAMFLSKRVDAGHLLGSVRALVVDEIHAFAGDDRGWHLLAVLARLDALTGREIQRVGLTATVGNPEQLLDWLICGGSGERRTVLVGPSDDSDPAVEIDFVGSVPNAAKVIASLHRGEKRLVFADSRARVEELAVALRGGGVTTFVSHSSLSADERRQAERAFGEARDCVIVATSTLELGIDVGDLDRVVQLGAPRTVASVLQRMGRTGRRSGTRRNCLFLATTEMELLQALALERLVRAGWVEPLEAPAWPIHLAAQQLLARILAAGRIGPSTWPGEFRAVQNQAGLEDQAVASVITHCLERGIIVEADLGWQIGEAGERAFGSRHFMELTSLFLTAPLLNVRWGQRVIGQADPSSLSTRDGQTPTILLGGRAWAVRDVDWQRRVVWVEPVDEPGRSRWIGPGGALSIEVCHALRTVVATGETALGLTKRGAAKLGEILDEFWWAEEGTTTLQLDRDRTKWWTFGGAKANTAVAFQLAEGGIKTAAVDDLAITLVGSVSATRLKEMLKVADPAVTAPADPRRLEDLKFSAALPLATGLELLERRDRDPVGVSAMEVEPVTAANSGAR